MDEYLEKSKIINLIEHNDKVYHYADRDKENIVHDTIQTLCRVIIEAEAEAAQHVKHGRWKYYKNNGIIDTYICTNCQSKVEMAIDVEPSKFKYCPNCGARMDGDTD